jgi:hypothetical protein
MTSPSHPNRFLAGVFAIAWAVFSAALWAVSGAVALALRADAALNRYTRRCIRGPVARAAHR